METLTKEIILQKISENKAEIKKFGVKKLILFGSYARDEQTEDSDIDFLVEFEKGREKNVDDYLELLFFLEDTFSKKIDLVKPELIRDFLKSSILGGIQHEAKI